VLVDTAPERCTPGDLWQLGNHRLICGDALDVSVVEQLMDNENARMVFTDPPYNVPIDGHVGGSGKTKHREFEMATGEMTADQFTSFLRRSFENMARHSLDGAIHFVCMDWRHMAEMLEAGKTVYSELKNLIVWVKDNGGMGTFYRSRHELVFAFKVGSASHINSFELGQHGRYRTNVWQYKGANSFHAGRMDELAMHPTVKPVQMIADAIKDVSGRGDIVLDLFGGSGSTLIAAHKTGRRAFLCELDPVYCDHIIARWEAFEKDDAIQLACGCDQGARTREASFISAQPCLTFPEYHADLGHQAVDHFLPLDPPTLAQFHRDFRKSSQYLFCRRQFLTHLAEAFVPRQQRMNRELCLRIATRCRRQCQFPVRQSARHVRQFSKNAPHAAHCSVAL
jgi:DNA modification methylase